MLICRIILLSGPILQQFLSWTQFVTVNQSNKIGYRLVYGWSGLVTNFNGPIPDRLTSLHETRKRLAIGFWFENDEMDIFSSSLGGGKGTQLRFFHLKLLLSLSNLGSVKSVQLKCAKLTIFWGCRDATHDSVILFGFLIWLSGPPNRSPFLLNMINSHFKSRKSTKLSAKFRLRTHSHLKNKKKINK